MQKDLERGIIMIKIYLISMRSENKKYKLKGKYHISDIRLTVQYRYVIQKGKFETKRQWLEENKIVWQTNHPQGGFKKSKYRHDT